MAKQMVEQPRGPCRELSAMVHLRALRDYAKVDHGRFLPIVLWTDVHSFPPPQTPGRPEKMVVEGRVVTATTATVTQTGSRRLSPPHGVPNLRGILETCRPRADILSGVFNPEIFTASLSQVLDFYRGKKTVIHNLYTDARQFFTQATYPTDGLRRVLYEVFGRLAGDNTMPAIHRLETGFGGGKTHTLIASTHLAFKGRELADVVQKTLDSPEHAISAKLSEPGQIAVVGVAGDEIPVSKPRGSDLVPYTLWGEIAFQIGGEALYRTVNAEALSFEEGKTYFEKVFGGRKVLVMLDELAQYATRLEGARPSGAQQLAAFLMSLHGYAHALKGVAQGVLQLRHLLRAVALGELLAMP